MCHLSPVTCHHRQQPQTLLLLTPALRTVSVGQLVCQDINFHLFDQKYPVHVVPGTGQGDNKHMDIATYRSNWPRGRLIFFFFKFQSW